MCDHCHPTTNASKKGPSNPLRFDPSRTTRISNQFTRDMRARFRSLKLVVVQFISKEDELGLDPRKPFNPLATNAKKYEFLTSDKKLDEFDKWFQAQLDGKLLKVSPGEDAWTAKYVDSAYRQGVVRAYTDVHSEELAARPDFYQGSKAQFLQTAFAQPERMSKIRMLSTRTFNELKGVTSTMGTQMNRILAQGIADGRGARAIARDMVNRIEGLERTRALMITRTEIVHAHAEGQLDGMRDLGVQTVGAMVEWSTAGDDAVCPDCAAMQGKTFTLDEAAGMIPLHPNCRCAWIPANVGEARK